MSCKGLKIIAFLTLTTCTTFSTLFINLFNLLNHVHVTTRSFVIHEEMTVSPGDPLDSAALAESARNLRALGIFRSVAIDTVRAPDGLDVRVDTHDAWTTNPTIKLQTS